MKAGRHAERQTGGVVRASPTAAVNGFGDRLKKTFKISPWETVLVHNRRGKLYRSSLVM